MVQQDIQIDSPNPITPAVTSKSQNSIVPDVSKIQKSASGSTIQLASQKYVLGLISLALVVFLWVSSSFVMSMLLQIYPKAFFATYLSLATLQFYFPILYIGSLLKRKKLASDESEKSITRSSPSSATPQKPSKLTKREMLQHSFVFFSIYFISCYLANLAFEYTDVVSATLLLSTSCFFTLIFSIIAGFERFSLMKGLSVLVSISGVFIVCLLSYIYDQTPSSSYPPVNVILGNVFAVASASLYGLYSVILKKKAIDESRINMPFFFGCVGLLSTTLLWPCFLFLHITRLEIFEVPTLFSLGLLFANNIFGCLAANYFWIYAIVHTSPLVVSIGLALSIPTTIVFDMLINGNSVFHLRSLAGICIVVGFVILNLASIYPTFNNFFERSCLFAYCQKKHSSTNCDATVTVPMAP